MVYVVIQTRDVELMATVIEPRIALVREDRFMTQFAVGDHIFTFFEFKFIVKADRMDV